MGQGLRLQASLSCAPSNSRASANSGEGSPLKIPSLTFAPKCNAVVEMSAVHGDRETQFGQVRTCGGIARISPKQSIPAWLLRQDALDNFCRTCCAALVAGKWNVAL